MDNEWRVRDAVFDKSTWRASVFLVEHGVEQAPPYEVIRSYDASLSDFPGQPGVSVTLEHGAVATLTVAELQEPSVAAIWPPLDDKKTVLELRVGRILSISRTESSLLRDDVRPFIQAVRRGDAAELQSAPISRLALWLLTTTEPLGASLEEIMLGRCSATIGAHSFELHPAVDGTTLRLPAQIADEVRLSMSFRLRVSTPYRDRLDVHESPLPDYALSGVFTDGGRSRVFGRALGNGTFELGPFKLRSFRRLRYEAALPLDPPGDRPALTGFILIRNGRPIEEWLDSGQLPVPRTPPNLTPEALPSEVIRQAAGCLNTDVGTVGDLFGSDFLTLYEMAPEQVERHPDLREMVLDAMDEAQYQAPANEREYICQYPAQLSSGVGWTEGDVAVALGTPSCATRFAEKVLAEVEPRGSRFGAKEEASTSEPDHISVRPHAAAVAALAHALTVNGPSNVPEKLRKALQQQLQHLQTRHMPVVASWSTWEFLEVCELLKLKSVGETSAAEIVGSLSKEAFRRFGVEQLSMREKLRIARMFALRSTVDRPSLPPRPRQEKEGTMVALEEDRRRYSCALQRAIEEQGKFPRSVTERKQWMEDFLDRWRDFLDSSHKSGHLQRFLPDLEADRKRALKAVE